MTKLTNREALTVTLAAMAGTGAAIFLISLFLHLTLEAQTAWKPPLPTLPGQRTPAETACEYQDLTRTMPLEPSSTSGSSRKHPASRERPTETTLMPLTPL